MREPLIFYESKTRTTDPVELLNQHSLRQRLPESLGGDKPYFDSTSGLETLLYPLFAMPIGVSQGADLHNQIATASVSSTAEETEISISILACQYHTMSKATVSLIHTNMKFGLASSITAR